MTQPNPRDKKFLNDLREIIEKNISSDQFGVSELASAAAMSRSNLLRRIKKTSGLSASQFIRVVRLEQAMEMLNDPSVTVSEVSYRVGFSSNSYFIKCFHDHYGYPPGEVLKHLRGLRQGRLVTLDVDRAFAGRHTDAERGTDLSQVLVPRAEDGEQPRGVDDRNCRSGH